MAKVDLHIHNDNSDGSDSVKKLTEKIIKNNIEICALYDIRYVIAVAVGQAMPDKICVGILSAYTKILRQTKVRPTC